MVESLAEVGSEGPSSATSSLRTFRTTSLKKMALKKMALKKMALKKMAPKTRWWSTR